MKKCRLEIILAANKTKIFWKRVKIIIMSVYYTINVRRDLSSIIFYFSISAI